MSQPMYDFRDGILLEKVVYKDTSCNFGYVLLYIACLLLTWIWGSGWFALFFYAYVFHEYPTYIILIVIWLVFAITVIVIGILTIQRSKNEKRRKREEKEERERQLKAINEAKRKRNENIRANNLNDINTNIEKEDNINNLYESERRPTMNNNDNKFFDTN